MARFFPVIHTLQTNNNNEEKVQDDKCLAKIVDGWERSIGSPGNDSPSGSSQLSLFPDDFPPPVDHNDHI